MTLEGREGDILTFPINDQDTQIMKSATQVDKYNVIGFAALLLEDVLTVQEAGGDGGFCTITRSFPTASPLSLNDPNVLSECGIAQAPNTLTNLELTAPGNPPCCTEGNHYSYDATNRVVTWTHPEPRQNVDVSFDWENQGVCGEAPPDNASARCLIVSWQGYQFGGQGSGGGADFGMQSIRLCELDIAGSCPE